MLVRVLPIIPRVKSVYRRADSYLPKITNNIKMSTIDDIESLMKSMRLSGSAAEAGRDYKPSLEAEAGRDYKRLYLENATRSSSYGRR